MWAYFAEGVKERDARTDPAFSRIMHCGKWSFAKHKHNGKKGAIAFWGPKAPARGSLPEPQQLHDDGLWYYKPAELPSQRQLAKEHGYPKYDYLTNTGHTISIPLAVGGPRIIDFCTNSFGNYSDDFALKAQEIERLILDGEADEILLDDPRVMGLIIKAIEQTYRVTAELLSELQWVNTLDIAPIYDIIRGVYPKLPSNGLITSDLSLQESNKNQGVLLANGVE